MKFRKDWGGGGCQGASLTFSTNYVWLLQPSKPDNSDKYPYVA